MDEYNDYRAETLSARSWSLRSLFHEHSNNLINIFESKGWDADFVLFEKTNLYHYRDPVTYAEMRGIVAKLQMEKATRDLKNCLCFSVQIDGIADRKQIDSKFVTARFIPSNEISVQTLFLRISSSDTGGAEGLLDSVLNFHTPTRYKNTTIQQNVNNTSTLIRGTLQYLRYVALDADLVPWFTYLQRNLSSFPLAHPKYYFQISKTSLPLFHFF